MFLNHCHVFPEGAFGPERSEFGSLPELARFMTATGIEKTVALAPFWGPQTGEMLAGEDPNDWLCRRLEEYPNIVGAVAVNPTSPDACAIVERCVRRGCVGIKTHPPAMGFRIDDPAGDELYALAAELGVFVLFHTGVHGGRLEDYQPILIDNVMARHLRLKVIIAHMGISGGIGRGFFDQALAVVYNHSSRWTGGGVYAGLTGMAKPQHRQLVADTIDEAGAQRSIFGLDWPAPGGLAESVARFESELAVMRSIGLTSEQEALVFGGALAELTGA